MPESNPKILIVYGDETVRESLTTLMEREGFRTLQANSGTIGLDVIRTASPDLMLLEIKMSDVDGINLLRKAKDLDPNLLIIAITAYCDSYSAARALEGGAYDYIERPFPIREVTKVVRQALSKPMLK
jgi:two-component system NtrC family response regulator